MLKRQLVLVAIDHATDVERTMEAALGAAKARGADVHAIEVVPHRAVLVDDRRDPWTFAPHDDRGVAIGPRLASIPRSADHDGVRVRRVTLRGEPAHVFPAYAQLHEASVLVVERDYGSSRFWRNGRVVDAMAGRSPIPLLVLPKRRATERDESAPRRILIPVDFSIASAVALRTAVELARRHGARLTLLHTLTRCDSAHDLQRRRGVGGDSTTSCTKGSGCGTPSPQGGVLRGGRCRHRGGDWPRRRRDTRDRSTQRSGPDRDGNCASFMARPRAVRFDAAPRPAASDGAGSGGSRGRRCSRMAERASR